MLDEVGNILDLFVGDEAALDTGRLVCADGAKEHIAVADKLLRAGHIEYRSRIDRRRNGERDTAGDIRFDNTCDNIDGGALSRYDKMHTCGTRFLSEAAYRILDFIGRDHHKIGKLIDENNYLMHRAQRLIALG